MIVRIVIITLAFAIVSCEDSKEQTSNSNNNILTNNTNIPTENERTDGRVYSWLENYDIGK